MVCKKCGNTDIHKLVWININTGEISYDELNNRCTNCGQYVEVVTIDEYNQNQ